MTFRKLASYIHRILGLVSGTIVVISFLPAAVYVWERELTDWYYSGYVFHEPQEQTLPLSRIWENAQRALPAKHYISFLETSRDPGRAYIFTSIKRTDRPGISFFSEFEYWERVYVNQYTGEVKGIIEMKKEWITLLRYLHQQLLLRYSIGHLVVGYATLIMFLLILTGLILWWPRNKAALKQRFKIKWKAKKQRVNYDIHNVGGFYTHAIILVLAISGLCWTFTWWEDGVYFLFGYHPQKKEALKPPPLNAKAERQIDLIYQNMLAKRTGWKDISLYQGEGATTITGVVHFDTTSGWDTWDSYTFNPATAQLIDSNKHEAKPLGVKWRSSNYAIHVGSIYGWPTKILASFAALFCSSLPITGFLIWYNRKWGKKKKVLRKPTKLSFPEP
jgi:uncharacterized iron-regulated membrane protein